MMLASHSAEFNTLIEGLADADETTRRHSAEDLADFRDPAASKWLAATLGDPSAAVRETVVDALVTIGGEETAAEIIPFMASDDPACRNAACESLRRIGPKAAGPLGRAIEGGDRDVRIFSLDILSEIGGTAAIAGIARVLENPDPNLAAAAALALGKIGSEEAVASLTARPSPEPWVRCAIAESRSRSFTGSPLPRFSALTPGSRCRRASANASTTSSTYTKSRICMPSPKISIS